MFAVGLLVACSGTDEADVAGDVRVDHVSKDADAESVSPRSCVTPGGRIYAVWQDDRDGTDAIWFNTSPDAGLTWGDRDQRLNTGEAEATAPAVACAGDDVYVVWEDARDGELAYHNIYVSVSTDAGETWSLDRSLDDDVDGEAMSVGPTVFAVDDLAYVAWFDSRDGAYDIYVQATGDAGGTWLDHPVRADADEAGAAYSAWPRLAADGDGRVIVAWEDSRDGDSDVYAASSDDFGATFSGETRLDVGDDAGSANSFVPRLAMAGDHVYAVWQDERSGEARTVLMNVSSDAGRTWLDAPVAIPGEDAGDAIAPEVAAVGDRVHVVWQDDRYGGYDVYHRVSADGGATWADEVRMDTDAGGEAQSYEPVVSVRDDNVLVAWQEYRDDRDHVGFNDLYYNWSGDGGLHWSEQDLRINANEPGTAYQVDLSVAVGEDVFVALWADGRYGTSDVFCAERTLGEEGQYVPPEDDEK